jgi:hypothetical protein
MAPEPGYQTEVSSTNSVVRFFKSIIACIFKFITKASFFPQAIVVHKIQRFFPVALSLYILPIFRWWQLPPQNLGHGHHINFAVPSFVFCTFRILFLAFEEEA